MDRFGGGGHMNLAGAQIRDRMTGEVIQMIKHTIERLVEEGEIE